MADGTGGTAFDVDVSMVIADRVPHDSQTETGTAAAEQLPGVEGLEDPLEMLFSDPSTAILHGQSHGVPDIDSFVAAPRSIDMLASCADRHLPFPITGFNRVENEVGLGLAKVDV